MDDALEKLQRQESGRLVVFFALTGIDFGTNRHQALTEVGQWAFTASAEHSCGIVVAYKHEWRNPLVREGI